MPPRRLIAAAGPFLAAACFPAAAAAGTAEIQRYEVHPRGGTATVARVIYNAGPGEANRLTVAYDPGGVTIRDSAGVAPGAGCSRPTADPQQVRCDFQGAPLEPEVRASDLRVSLGDRADTASVSGQTPAGRSGGPLPGDAVIAGGAGDDRLDAGSIFGVLEGGRGNDLMTAASGPVEFRGGGGNDRMVGGPGPDRFIAGRGADGRDTMIGGGETDLVSYEARTRSVRADLQGDRDDGARHERDRIAKDVEALAGGAGSDRLFGDAHANNLYAGNGRDLLVGAAGADSLSGGTPAPDNGSGGGADRMLGGAGDDFVVGGTGADVLDGGPGRDLVIGNAGDDRLELRDGGPDEGRCGDGRDRIQLDQQDYFTNKYEGPCEVVTRTRPPVAVLFGKNEVLRDGAEPAVHAVVGCPGDAPAACTGEGEMIVDGRSGGPGQFTVNPSEFGVRVPLDAESWDRSGGGKPVTGDLILRVREPSGTVVRFVYRVTIV
jgi:hypothetical protein